MAGVFIGTVTNKFDENALIINFIVFLYRQICTILQSSLSKDALVQPQEGLQQVERN